MSKSISGFSKLSKRGKLKWIVENFFPDPKGVMIELMSYWLDDEDKQRMLDSFSENTISNFPLPYGVAPNFVINGKTYVVPMVIEESSVVAAASSAAKYWQSRGGIQARVISRIKIGQVHFLWAGKYEKLRLILPELSDALTSDAKYITENMEKRGGGIRKIELLDMTDQDRDYYQLRVSFDTCDSMGANFINSVLEEFAKTLTVFIMKHPMIDDEERDVRIIMSILSNYTPDCLVHAEVSCPVEALGPIEGMTAANFADKFHTAIRIAKIDPYRATTHNKGIFNGIDAVVLATANDFRSIEACGHTYASRDGQYRSLSDCSVENGIFRFWLEIPLSLGTVGGLTSLHPMARRSLELLGNPNIDELMEIVASTGLAQNFAAIRSLITTGIQKGHMRMHLQNILISLNATERETDLTLAHFNNKVVSYSSVTQYIDSLRAVAGS